jgi:hypothetical protein
VYFRDALKPGDRNVGVNGFMFAVFKNEVMIAANRACGASLIARKAENDKENSCLLANRLSHLAHSNDG